MLYIIEWLLLILSTSLPSLDIKFEKCSDAIFGYSEGNGGRYGRYDLSMSYDDLWRVTSKTLDLWRHTAPHSPRQYAGYSLSYGYGTDDGTRFRLSTIAETHYRVENDTVGARRQTFHRYQYDGSGNLTHEESGHPVAGGAVNWKSGERKLLWDAENRLKALDENGYISTYVYDADGERVVKQHGGNRGLYVNSAGRDSLTETTAFTLYVNPYVTWTEGGKYVKHVYMGGSRVASRLGVAHLMGNNPIAALGGVLPGHVLKDSMQKAAVVTSYGVFGVPHGGEDRTAVLPFSNEPGNFLGDFTDPDSLEGRQYFYHPDHLGSSTVITDEDGNVVQHIEYMPYGEVFMEETGDTWNTPYKFNGKEYDEETGLYYYGARYYDPRLSIWISTDPTENKHPEISSYCYTDNNPIRFVDPDGMDWVEGVNGAITWRNSINAKNHAQLLGKEEIYRGTDYVRYKTWNNNRAKGLVQEHYKADKVLHYEVHDGTYQMDFTGNVITSKELTGRSLNPQKNAEYGIVGTAYLNAVFSDGGTYSTAKYKFASGPYGNGPTPNHDYTATNVVSTNENGMQIYGETGWKVYLENYKGRDGLRIHPDTNSPGTAGCIGIQGTADELKSLGKFFQNHIKTQGNSMKINFQIPNNPNYGNNGKANSNIGQ